jgi:hypothetical protein
MFLENVDVCGEKASLLQIKNTKGINFYVKIENFYPERCIPEFKFNPDKKEVSNSALWAPSVFWICDGDSCARDVFRMSNLTTKMASRLYGETIVEALFPTSHTVTREDLVNPNIQTLNQIIERGETWWAPIPDEIYKSKDGRDLNLEVICKMMVSILYFILIILDCLFNLRR